MTTHAPFLFVIVFATQALCLVDIQEDENGYLRENPSSFLFLLLWLILLPYHAQHSWWHGLFLSLARRWSLLALAFAAKVLL
jgi:hypothetical protein